MKATREMGAGCPAVIQLETLSQAPRVCWDWEREVGSAHHHWLRHVAVACSILWQISFPKVQARGAPVLAPSTSSSIELVSSQELRSAASGWEQ